MKNWTVTFYVPYRLGSEKLYTKINEYVSAETGAEAARIAEDKACEEYEHATFWALDECTTDPETAKEYDELCSEEYDSSADDIRESLTHERIGLMYCTYDLYDNDDNMIACDLEIQIYLNTRTNQWEILTAGESALVLTIDADKAPAMGFDEMYYTFGNDIRRWWIEHPEELKDWYGATLPEGFEL